MEVCAFAYFSNNHIELICLPHLMNMEREKERKKKKTRRMVASVE
jgi:hypothetical protein